MTRSCIIWRLHGALLTMLTPPVFAGQAPPFMQGFEMQAVPVNKTKHLKLIKTTLKPPVEKMIRSGIVYKITCPRCTACYVGQSSQHLQTHFREHTRNPGPVKTHLRNCNTTVTEEHIDILASTSRGEGYLLTLEALFIQELEPKINTNDEWRSRTLTIKI